jgi:hypothetical protein
MALQGKNPVIWLSFKDVKMGNFASSYQMLINIVAEEYSRHRYLINSDQLTDENKAFYQRIISENGTPKDYEISIKSLCSFLELHHGTKTVLLIDEYDSPINDAYSSNYYPEMITFLRTMYSVALKDNIHLERAVLTGIYRVAKESIFSGLNNLKVASMLDIEFADKFGFTEAEVEKILADHEISTAIDDVKLWYNGYIFGKKTTIYNPWSILSFVDSPDHSLQDYWVNTSNNDIIKKMIADSNAETKQEFEILLQGGTIEKPISEDIVYGTIDQTPDAIWSFFLFSGYLKLIEQKTINREKYGVFKIPNLEIETILFQSVRFWFERSHSYSTLNNLLKALIKKDLELFSDLFNDFITKVLSYYDFANKEPERVYHALVLGMMVNLSSDYVISSNRESGYGRYDIVFKPLKPGLKPYIFEFKKFKKSDEKTIKNTLDNAMNQIKTKEYASALLNEGFTDINLVAIAFKGKDVKMVWEKI